MEPKEFSGFEFYLHFVAVSLLSVTLVARPYSSEVSSLSPLLKFIAISIFSYIIVLAYELKHINTISWIMNSRDFRNSIRVYKNSFVLRHLEQSRVSITEIFKIACGNKDTADLKCNLS